MIINHFTDTIADTITTHSALAWCISAKTQELELELDLSDAVYIFILTSYIMEIGDECWGRPVLPSDRHNTQYKYD